MNDSIPEGLLSVVRNATTGEVSSAVHAESRRRWLETWDGGSKARRGGRVALVALVAGATLIALLVLGWRAPTRRDAEHAITADTTPLPSAEISATRPATETLPGSEAVVQKLAPEFRRCYSRGLTDGVTAGHVLIVARIGSAGDVLSTSVASNDGLTAEVVDCLVSVVRGARFSATGHPAALRIPIRFTATH